MVTSEELSYPVLVVDAGGYIVSVADAEALETSEEMLPALRTRRLDEVFVVDGNGQTFAVIQVRDSPISGPRAPWGIGSLFGRKLRRTTLDLRPAGRLALQELRDRLGPVMRRLPDVWNELSKEDDRGKIDRARSIPEVIAQFPIWGTLPRP